MTTVCVREIPENGSNVKHICCGSGIGRYADFCTFVRAQTALTSVNKDLLDFALKVVSILAEYPNAPKCGIAARAYPRHRVLTIGFTDHLGEWDPVLTFPFSDVIVLTIEDIREEVRREFENA